jgi:DNA-binding response OmpR family regulator
MSRRILVVEDQEDLRAILRDFLSASGYTVIEAVDGDCPGIELRAARAFALQQLSRPPHG